MTYELDTTPPAAPALGGGPDPFDPDDTPTWAFTADPGTSTACRVDDGDWFTCAGAASADLTAASDGIHSIEIRSTDGVGNLGPSTTATYVLDRHAPDPPAFLTTPLSPGNGTAPAWTFTVEAGTDTTCSLDGGPWVPCDDAYVADLEDADDGTHVVQVRSIDAAGNVSPALAWTYELDRTPPGPAGVTGPGPVGNDPTPEWTIEIGPDDRAECALDGAPFAACGALFTADLIGAEQGHELVVRVVDTAGNVSAPTTARYRLDTTPPAAPTITAAATDEGWEWGLTGEPGGALECSLDGGPWFPCARSLPPRADANRLDVRARDDAGNYSTVTSWTAPATVPEPGRTIVSAGAVANPQASPGPANPGPAPLTTVATPAPATPAAPAVGTELPVPPGSRWVDTGDEPKARGEGRTAVAAILQAAVQRTTVPLLLVLLVLGFVAVQNQIDRRDPKLASAPVRAEPEYMEFK